MRTSIDQAACDAELAAWRAALGGAVAHQVEWAMRAMQTNIAQPVGLDVAITALNAVSRAPEVHELLARAYRWSVANERIRFAAMLDEQERDLTIPPHTMVDRVARWLRS